MAELTDADTIRDRVREKYAAAARAAAAGAAAPSSCCGPTEVPLTDASGTQVFGDALYDADEAAGAASAVGASLGCGVPTAVADLHEGETVLDLGSGAGADVLISARRVGASGRAIGLDMTDEMLELARANAAAAGVANVEFVKGHIEDIPLADATVDVVISNCVINLSGDKAAVLREVARVLRPGGRFAVSDVIADPEMDAATRADMAAVDGLHRRRAHARRVRRAARGGRPGRRRDPRDASRARARRCGDRARRQAPAVTATRVAINGFGRMGRLALRAAWDCADLRVRPRQRAAGDAACAAHLLCFDSVHGRWDRGGHRRTASTLTVDGVALSYGAAAAPGDVPWERARRRDRARVHRAVPHASSRCSRTSSAA